jgi:hypothetical protein
VEDDEGEQEELPVDIKFGHDDIDIRDTWPQTRQMGKSLMKGKIKIEKKKDEIRSQK